MSLLILHKEIWNLECISYKHVFKNILRKYDLPPDGLLKQVSKLIIEGMKWFYDKGILKGLIFKPSN